MRKFQQNGTSFPGRRGGDVWARTQKILVGKIQGRRKKYVYHVAPLPFYSQWRPPDTG